VANDPSDVPPADDPNLSSLEARLEKARKAEVERTAEPKAPMGMSGKGSQQGQRVLSILLGYPLGGGVIGWYLDGRLDSRPWIMLGLLFLAFAAACYQVFKLSKERPE
jgi:ATP synthase protein I